MTVMFSVRVWDDWNHNGDTDSKVRMPEMGLKFVIDAFDGT
jgi:hypothetical protein